MRSRQVRSHAPSRAATDSVRRAVANPTRSTCFIYASVYAGKRVQFGRKISLDSDAASEWTMWVHYRVQEFARLAGLTVRALHHYDRLSLLRARRTVSR
jgi:hypothetical protein